MLNYVKSGRWYVQCVGRGILVFRWPLHYDNIDRYNGIEDRSAYRNPKIRRPQNEE